MTRRLPQTTTSSSRAAQRPRSPREYSLPLPSHTPSQDGRELNVAGPNRDVILKLLAFTLAMIVVPIGSYFATVNTVFKGKQAAVLFWGPARLSNAGRQWQCTLANRLTQATRPMRAAWRPSWPM